MQITEFKRGWIRRRYLIACTLLAADLPQLESELAAAKEQLAESVEFHHGQCTGVKIVIASGLQSSRAIRPAIRERIENDPDLQKLARTCRVAVSFLNRMGDSEGEFKVKKL